MTAYEVADAITNCTTDPLHNDAANMLRQQADRIAELEKELDIQFKNGFEAGKLEGWKAHKYRSTPQTKPLSDEEIWSFADMVLENSDVIGFARAIEERHGIK